MTVSGFSDQAWRAFSDDLMATIDPQRLALCFDGHIATDLCARLKASMRLRERLAGIVSARFDLLPLLEDPGGSEGDKAVAMASPEVLLKIVSRAGAIYWSAAIANTVLAADVAALQKEIGEELCAFAVKHRDLAGPELTLPPRETLSGEFSDTGWCCLAAWCDAVDPAIGVRVRLKLPPHAILDAPPPEEFREHGPEIVRRAAIE